MPHERKPADNAVEWLNRARSDLTLAGNRIECVYLEDLCFHAQQAAEKGLKAIFVSHGWRYPYAHDLSTLITELLKFKLDVPADVQDCVVLTEYAVEGRYPGFDEPVSEEEYLDAIVKAKRVLQWASSTVNART
jgi:HEPN domain-containing protein